MRGYIIILSLLLGGVFFLWFAVAVEATGTVSGTVTESNGTTPVASAPVSIHTDNWSTAYSTSTNTSGAFQFSEAIPAGTYKITIWANHATEKDPPESTVTVVDNQATTVNIKLVVPNITLKVYEPNGTTPVQSQGMSLYKDGDNSFYQSTQTNAAGDASFAVSVSGTYRLEFWGSSSSQYDRPANTSFTYSGSTMNLGNFLLRVPAAKVKVLVPDGSAAQYTSVSVHDSAYSSSGTWWGSTDSSGVATVAALPTGTYTLEIQPPSSSGSTSYVAPDPVTLNLTAGTTNTTYFDAPLSLTTPKKTITGTVRFPDGSPVSNASYSAWRVNGSGYSYGETNALGQFTTVVGQGTYEISVNFSYSGTSSSSGTSTARDWAYTGKPKTVKFELSNTVAESTSVDFIVTKLTSRITGKILDPDGNVITTGWMTVNANNDSIWNSADVDRTAGTFTVRVAKGTYRVEFSGGASTGSSESDWGTPTIGSITIGDNETYDLGTLRMLRRDARVTGRVVDSNGAPVANQYVNLWGVRTQDWGWAQTDSNGNYTIKVIGGREVEVSAFPGWTFDSSVRYINTSPPARVTAPANGSVTANWTFTIADAKIKGTVVDANGNVVSNLYGWVDAKVAGTDASGRYWGGIGAPITNGSFSLDVAGGYTWELSTWMSPQSGYSTGASKQVAVSAGETKEGVQIQLLKNDVTVRGSLVDPSGNAVEVPFAMVFAENDHGGYQWATVGESSFSDSAMAAASTVGAASLAGSSYELKLSAGTWRLSYSLPFDSDWLANYLSSVELTVKAGETVTQNLVVREADAEIRVTVTDPSGSPVQNAWIDVATKLAGKTIADDNPFGYYGRGNFTDQNGQVTVNVPADLAYYVSAFVPPGKTWVAPPAETAKPTGENPASVAIQFRDPDVTVSGTLELNGSGAEGLVWAWSEDGQTASTEPEADGDYTLALLSGTEWHIGGTYDDGDTAYESAETLITPEADSTVERDIALAGDTATSLPSDASQTFAAENTVALTVGTNDDFTMSMPARSVSSESDQDVSVTVTPTGETVTQSDDHPIGTAYAVEGHFASGSSSGQEITDLDGNVTLTLCYSESTIPEGVEEGDITIGYFDENAGTWRTVENIVVDADDNCVTGTTDHFTLFSLLTPNGSNDGTVNDVPDAPVPEGDDDDPTGTPVMGSGTRDIVVTPVATSAGTQIRVLDRDGMLLASWFAYANTIRGKVYVEIGDFDGDGDDDIAVSAGRGLGAHIRIFTKSGTLLAEWFAYDAQYRNGVRLASGDVDGDGVTDLIAYPEGVAKANIRVYRYDSAETSWELLDWVWGFAEIPVSMELVAADVTGDSKAELIASVIAGGGPQVRVFGYSATNGLTLTDSFFAYAEASRHGVRATVGDVNNDGVNDIVTVPYWRAGGHVRAFTYASGEFAELASYFPYGTGFRGRLQVKVTNVDNSGVKEIVTLPLDTKTNLRAYSYDSTDDAFELLTWLFTHNTAFRGGGELTIANTNGNTLPELVVVPNTGGGSNLRVFEFNPTTGELELLDWTMTHQAGYRGGTTVTASDLDGNGKSELIVGVDSTDGSAGPNVRVYSNVSGELTLDAWFWGFAETFRGGTAIKTMR